MLVAYEFWWGKQAPQYPCLDNVSTIDDSERFSLAVATIF